MIKNKLTLILIMISILIMFTACSDEPVVYTEPLTEGVVVKVLDINASKNTLLVAGLEEDSIVGTQCYVTGYSDGFSVLQLIKDDYQKASFGKIIEGDVLTLTLLGGVDDSYPTQATAVEFKINPVPTNPSLDPLVIWPYNAEKLDENIKMEELVELLVYPEAAPVDDIKIKPGDESSLTLTFDTDASYLDSADYNPYDQNAIILFSLFDDMQELVYIFGSQEIPYTRKWAESVVTTTFINELIDVEDFGALLSVVYETTSADDDFFVVNIFEIKSDGTAIELFSSIDRTVFYNVKDIVVMQGEPIADSDGEIPSDVKNYIYLNFTTLQTSTTTIEDYYLYEKDGSYYMEIVDQGIWEVDPDILDTFLSIDPTE